MKIDFQEHADAELTIPLGKDKMLEILEELSSIDDISFYLDSTANAISNLVAMRDILTASSPSRREELLDRLSEDQLETFSNLVINLWSYIRTEGELRYINEIIQASYSRKTIAEGDLEKAHKLLAALSGKDEIIESQATDLLVFSKQLFYLGCIFYGYKTQKNDPSWVNVIAGLGESNLNYLIAISGTITLKRFTFIPKYGNI